MKKRILMITILVLLSGFGLTELAAATSGTADGVGPPLAAAITATPSPTSPPTGPQPGAAGIGDPYYAELGNGGYDVDHYDLELDVDMPSGVLTGTMTMTAVASQTLSSFNLDFQGFEIAAVTVNNTPADYSQTEHELTITPAEPLLAESEFTVSVSYSGVPEPVEAYTELPFPIGWIQAGEVVYVVSEPNGAAGWYPVNDHPRDKATYTFRITVPKPYVAAANGLLQETEETDETTTYVWAANDPMASYLATLVIGDFAVQEEEVTWTPGETAGGLPEEAEAQATAQPETAVEATTEAPTAAAGEVVPPEPVSLPVRYYYPADWEPASLAVFTDTAEMLAYFSTVFGPYPFETYGVAVVDTTWPDALETQTLPIFGGAGLTEGQLDEMDAAEALAHQWFGNSVSPDTWQDVWLSEGFADYATWLWVEHTGGIEARDALIRERYRALTIDEPLSLLQEQEQPATDEAFTLATAEFFPPPAAPPAEHLFNGSVYDRGALTLHALRLRVGDETFFNILQSYLDQYQYGTTSTADIIAVAEEISGESLTDFFESWLYGQEMPDLPELSLYRKIEAAVKTPSLRLRSGPGTEYSALGSAGQGETVHVLSQVNDCEWLQVRTSAGVLGWMSGAADYVTLSQPCDAVALTDITPVPTVASLPTQESAAIPALAIGSTMVRERDGATMVYIPAGEFLMGSLEMIGDDYPNSVSVKEWPQHTVYLDAYWIDQTEVTNTQYNQCVLTGVCTGGNPAPEWANYPVTNVTWNQAQTYCYWVDGRLPTEAEWEKAARGTDGRTYPWGENIDCDHARYVGTPDCGSEMLPVGSLPAGVSPYGALDMAGNAAEWVADWMDVNYYEVSSTENPTGPPSPPEHPKGFKVRVVRSNAPFAFDIGGAGPKFQRTTNRSGGFPELARPSIGFRCAQSALPAVSTTSTQTVSALEQHFEQGFAYFEAEQWDQAIAEFQAAIQLDPTFGLAYLGLGYSYAYGPNDFAKAIAALETFLKLMPAAEDKAQVEEDIQFMKDKLDEQAESPFEIPPGMALFVFKNYSGEDWNVDIGPYSMQVPANPPDREYSYTTLPIPPGTYTWTAHSASGGYYITDGQGNKAFEFTVAAGEIYGTQCCN